MLNIYTFLHVGGCPKRKERTTKALSYWNELRFDIDASDQSDLVGTMADLSTVSAELVDAVFHHHKSDQDFLTLSK